MAERFPTARLTRAGATKDETARIRDQYDRSDLSVQTSMLEMLKSQPTSGVREYLQNWRDVHSSPQAIESAPESPQAPAALLTSDTPDGDEEGESDEIDPDDEGSDDPDASDELA